MIEVLAGAIGIVQTLTLLGSIDGLLTTAAFLFGLAFFSVSLWAGLELWSERPRGVTLSVGTWAAQVPQVLAPFELYFLAGPYLTLRVSNQFDAGIDFGAASAFMLLDAGRPGWHFGINVFALCLVFFLVRLRREREEEQELLASIEREEHRRAMNAA